jgi:hypothetical protein
MIAVVIVDSSRFVMVVGFLKVAALRRLYPPVWVENNHSFNIYNIGSKFNL